MQDTKIGDEDGSGSIPEIVDAMADTSNSMPENTVLSADGDVINLNEGDQNSFKG